jgi:hypothetical protein
VAIVTACLRPQRALAHKHIDARYAGSLGMLTRELNIPGLRRVSPALSTAATEKLYKFVRVPLPFLP